MTTTVLMTFGSVVGAVTGVALFVVGVLVLRALIRAQAPWWRFVAAPALLFGPAVGILAAALLDGREYLFGEGTPWEVNLAWSLLVFFGVTSVAALVRAFLQSRVVQEELGLKIPVLLLDAARYLLWIVMLFVVVGGIWGKTEWFTALFTASAVGTVILGLALQETLANFFAGMALVSERVYGIGDWVWVGDIEGEVIAITRRSTRLITRAGDLVTVSNRSVASSAIRNQSRPTPAHAELVSVSAPYETPPNRVRNVLFGALRSVNEILADPPPRVRLRRFGDSGIEYELKVYVDRVATMHDVLSELRVRIWYAFRRAGISIPFPIRELHRPGRGRGDAPAATGQVEERLKSVAFFEAMPEEILGTLVRAARFVDYGAGERIVQQGEEGRDCYVVDAGRVGVFVSDQGGERQVSTLGPGDLFGEMSLLTGEARSATVRTLEDTRLLRVGGSALGKALEAAPDLSQRLAELVVLRREGLLEARAALDAAARERVREGALRLSQVIRRFFRVQGR